jgi:hypothetical protein
MQKEMMTIESRRGAPTLEEAARMLKVGVEHLDKEFGVVLIDPNRHLYTVLVDAGAASTEAEGVRGPYSNPGIAHFGRPR